MRDVAGLVRPLYRLMARRVLSSHVVATDDTVMPMRAPGKAKQARLWVPIDNNVSEREMKRIALLRKNALFARNARGGRTAAVFSSLTSTCRRHGVDPQLYLTQLLANLPAWPMRDIDHWLPDVWKTRQPAAEQQAAVQLVQRSAYHRLFAAARWSLDELGLAVFGLILPLLSGVTLLAVDDTLARKRGLKVFGVGMHHDPLLSTRKPAVTNWAHCWVVLGVVLRLPCCGQRWFCLPVLFRLYVPHECAACTGRRDKYTRMRGQRGDLPWRKT